MHLSLPAGAAKGHAVNIAKLHAAKLDDAGENGSAPGSSKAGVDDNDGSRSRRRKRNKGDDDGSGEGGDGSGGDLGCPTVVADDEHDEHEGIDEASLREHEEVTKVKNVQTVELGRHIMEAWYFSPFPKEFYPAGFVERLYICEYSLRFFSHKSELERYQGRGVDPHPPGNEIYRHEGLAMFEVDGSESSEYCQNLCYLAKLFLDHKTLYYEVDPFLFYVMCTVDERGYHPTGFFSKVWCFVSSLVKKPDAGSLPQAWRLSFPGSSAEMRLHSVYLALLLLFFFFFFLPLLLLLISTPAAWDLLAPQPAFLPHDARRCPLPRHLRKEKYSDVGYNLACILTFPCYQRLGYGRFLIAFSYELSKKEFKVGSPEKPLSDLGAVSYRSYWSAEVLQVLHDFTGTSLSIMEISKQTSILSDDVINALQYLGILKYLNNYALCIPPDLLSDLVKRHPIKEPRVDPEKLHWAPLIGQFVGKDKWSIGAKRPDDRSE